MSWKEVYEIWKNSPNLEKNLKDELISLKNDSQALESAFIAPMEFGTAGMRGVIGVGINRMNIYTVRQAAEGLARLIDLKGLESKKQGVAIAYDSRHFSPEFAKEAAKVLAKHGITSLLFESLRPTPELSFAIRLKKATAGIMITASHNPAKYNGYKVYGEDGGQMPPHDADALTKYILAIENPLDVEVISEKQGVAQGLIQIIGEDIDREYLKLIKEVTINQELVDKIGKNLKLVYTPLHGTGEMLGRRALQQAGFTSISIVKEQALPDGNFSTVEVPNPEVPSAFNLAIKLGKKVAADVLVATDPDADRLGLAVRKADGEYQLLSGNQIAALLAKYILEAHKQRGTLPKNAIFIKSIVSTELVRKIAESYNVPTLNVLTGFKFIAEKIKEFEKTHEHTYLFGFEESYGYLIKPFVRDKDAIQALLLIAEVAAFYKEQGKTLDDGLQEIFKEYGYYSEKTISLMMDGIDGSQKQEKLMNKFRTSGIHSFSGIEVALTEDFQSGIARDDKGREEKIRTPPSNVLKYDLADGSWVAVRPSGTEPKIKFYLATSAQSRKQAEEKIKKLVKEVENFIKEV